MMKAVVYHGPEDLRVEQVEFPQIGPAEILVKVRAASICGTDLRILHGTHRKYLPGTVRIPGHEMVGTIEQVGKELQGVMPGQLVFVAPNWGCGRCRQCLAGRNNLCADYGAIGITQDGAFAEYLRVPTPAVLQGNVMPLEPTVDPAQASLIEPLACVLRGQDALGIQPGETVLVMGAGPIGILHIKLARLRGAGKVLISELQPGRLERALQLGADAGINPAQSDLGQFVLDETGGNGADAILVAAPSHLAQESALRAAAIGGRINFFGGLPKDRPMIQFDSNIVHYKELVVTGTTACSTGDCQRSAGIISSGRLDLSDLISDRFALEQASQAFQVAEDRNALKVIFEM
jgi:L-iditol 2-dehydrogenase